MSDRRCLHLSVVIGALLVPAAHAESFQDWKDQQQTEFRQVKDEFEAYRKELLAAFEEYRRKTGAVWGRDNVTPDRTNWVSYIDDLDNRSVVDFENGTVEVEIALPADAPVDDDAARRRLEQTLLAAIGQGFDDRPMQQIAKQPVSVPQGSPVLEGQIDDGSGNEAKPEEYRRIADEAAGNARTKRIRGGDGNTRVVYATQLKLVPDHIRRRALKYQPLVNRYAKEQGVPVPVVFAVMETESFFNPTARSHVPAFGLMQLVPTSGARDAYRYLYNQDRIVSDTYLYDPDNNVRLGSAYLHKLYYDYLAGVEDTESRLLCSIAAYNTGAGNVFRAYAGTYSRARHGSYSKYREQALRKINRQTPEQVYNHLRRKLKYREARDYIKKVTERMPKYGEGKG